MICPGFSLRPGSKLRELSVAARQGQFAIGDEREREFCRSADPGEQHAGGAAMDDGTQLFERAADRGSSDRDRGVGGRTFTMFHGTSWRNWQEIRRHGFKLSGSDSGLGEGVYLTRSERKAEAYMSKHGVIIKVRVKLGKMVTIDRQHHPLQKSWQRLGYDSAFAPAGAIGIREENCVLDPTRITVLGLAQGYRPPCRFGANCTKMDEGCGYDHGGLSDSEDGARGRNFHRQGNTKRNRRKSPSAKRHAAARKRQRTGHHYCEK